MAHPSRHLIPLLALFVALVLSAQLLAAAGGPAALVKDIEPTTSSINGPSPIHQIVVSGGVGYFFTIDFNSNQELWRTDGTEAGTFLLKDINTGDGMARRPTFGDITEPPFFTAVGDTVFFVANDGGHGAELWKTDGTPDGTLLVKDVWPGGEGSKPYELTAVGDRLFFLADDGEHGEELWVSDGTTAGTNLVKDLWPGPFGAGYGLTDVGGTLFLFAYTSLPNGERMLLWKSDGTEGGTLPVKGFKNYCLPPPFMESVGGMAYFAACSGSFQHEQLWRSDGTPQGTFPITNLPTPPPTPSPSLGPFVAFSELVPFDGALFFSTHNKLWHTTGLTETTVPIFDGAASQITAAGTKLFFAANSGGVGSELWVSDGTAGSATLVRDINPGSASSSPYRFVVVGDTIRFSADDGSHGRELWTSDGSEQGTSLLKDIHPGAQDSVPGYTPRRYNNDQFDRVEAITWDVLPNGQMLFAADDGTHGSELWRSDGTPEGTILLKDQLLSIGNAFVDSPVPLGDILLFNASFQNKRGLWKSDGSAANTTLITSSVELRGSGVVISDTLFFVGDDTTGNGSGLWRSDGTPEGTTRIRVAAGWLDSQIAALNGAIFFLENGQLWRSDGTPQGTQAITMVGLARMTVADGALYLSTAAGSQWMVWRSDGTTQGTMIVAQGRIETNGQPHHQPVGFIDLHGKTFFLAHGSAVELWALDRTFGGFQLVATVAPGDYFGRNDSTQQEIVRLGDKLFFTATDAAHGKELWVSDGTIGGTRLFHDIFPGRGSASPTQLAVIDGTLYFSAVAPGVGRELWRSDGTAAGTLLVQDIHPGTANANPSSLVGTTAGLFFRAGDAAHGYELWRSTNAGAALVQDINPGRANAVSGNVLYDGNTLRTSGDRLFFGANDGTHGYELWSLRPQDVLLPTATATGSPTLTHTATPTATPTDSGTPAATASPTSTPTATSTPQGPNVSGRTRVLLPVVR